MDRVLNFKKGDKCIIADDGCNIGRRKGYKARTLKNLNEWTVEGVITSVGRKYIKARPINRNYEITFSIEDDYREKYTYGCGDYILYKSIEDVKETIEFETHMSYLKSIFGSYLYTNMSSKITLNKVRRIIDIINE